MRPLGLRALCTIVVCSFATLGAAQFWPWFAPPPPPPPPRPYYPGQQFRYEQQQEPEVQRGEDVREAQLQLKKLGYLRGDADGVAGRETRSAMARFQGENGLTPDGRLGPATKGALERRAGRITPPEPRRETAEPVKPEPVRETTPEPTPAVTRTRKSTMPGTAASTEVTALDDQEPVTTGSATIESAAPVAATPAPETTPAPEAPAPQSF